MADSAGAIWWRPETEAGPALPGIGGRSLAFGGLVVFTVVLLLSPRSGVVTGSVIDWDQIVIGGHD